MRICISLILRYRLLCAQRRFDAKNILLLRPSSLAFSEERTICGRRRGVVAAANKNAIDEDARNTSLSGEILEGVLNIVHIRAIVELHHERLHADTFKCIFSLVAVRAR